MLLVLWSALHYIDPPEGQAGPLDVAQYGEIGCGKLVIVVLGPIEKRGAHFVSEGTTLADLPAAVGKFIACSQCEQLPIAVILRRRGESRGKTISLKKTEALKAVQLQDRDIVTFVTAHF